MRKLAGLCVLAAGVWGGGMTGSAEGQTQIVLRNAPPASLVELVLVTASGSKEASATTSPSGELDAVLDFGNLGKTRPAQIQVFVQGCNGAVKRVVLVAEGAEVPKDCDEQTVAGGEPRDRCGCRRLAAFWLDSRSKAVVVDWQVGTAEAVQARVGTGTSSGSGIARRLRAGSVWAKVSAGLAYMGKEKPDAFCPDLAASFTGSPFNVSSCSASRRDGIGSVSGGVMLTPWLGAQVAYRDLGQIALNGNARMQSGVTSIDYDNIGFFEAQAVAVEAVTVVEIVRRMTLHGFAGGSRWTSTSGNTQTLSGSIQRDLSSYRQRDSGFGPSAGASVQIHAGAISFGPSYHYTLMRSAKNTNEVKEHSSSIQFEATLYLRR